MWQMGGLGPMKGQLEHFQSLLLRDWIFGTCNTDQILKEYAPEKIEYSINRYSNETRRLYGTMENQLAKSSHGFLVGDRVTIADIACFGWISSHGMTFPSSLT